MEVAAPRRATYAGLFIVTFATLMYEVLLTRIFSVTMWHHFAFMSISIAMFGMSVGAVLVHVLPEFFSHGRTDEQISRFAALFSIAIVVSFLTHLSIPFAPRANLTFLFSLVLTYVALAIPFVCSGIVVCLALTRFPKFINRLYAFDLAGAAIGCLGVIVLLKFVDGVSAVFLVAAITSTGAIILSEPRSRLARRATIAAIILALCGIGNAFLAARQHPPIAILWAKGLPEPRPLYEKWDPLARVQVIGDPATPKAPFHFGLGSKYTAQTTVRELGLTVDATSFTVLTQFNGSFAGLDHLQYLVMNVAQYLKHDADVLVLGTGGGRDVLSSLAFGQRSVTGVEINPHVIDAVNQPFGDFTGHLDRDPRVRFVADDARNFVRGTSQRFDLILIASIGGVFVLQEQPLYTVEGWNAYLDRLKPGGILSVSRVFGPGGHAELLRATSLAYTTLSRRGVADPRRHIVVVRSDPAAQARPDTFGTILVCRDPFSDRQLDTLESVSNAKGFEIVLSPRAATDPLFAQVASGEAGEALMNRAGLDLTAPTDDRPFFFNVLRFRDL